jgi:hypothetical protein
MVFIYDLWRSVRIHSYSRLTFIAVIYQLSIIISQLIKFAVIFTEYLNNSNNNNNNMHVISISFLLYCIHPSIHRSFIYSFIHLYVLIMFICIIESPIACLYLPLLLSTVFHPPPASPHLTFSPHWWLLGWVNSFCTYSTSVTFPPLVSAHCYSADSNIVFLNLTL